jgi:hypothetical protein
MHPMAIEFETKRRLRFVNWVKSYPISFEFGNFKCLETISAFFFGQLEKISALIGWKYKKI